MVPLGKYMPHKHVNMSSDPQNPRKKLGPAVHSCNPSARRQRQENLWGSLASLAESGSSRFSERL